MVMFMQKADGGQNVKKMVLEPNSFLYFAKISIAFVLVLVLGAIFTLALEYLPVLILYLNSFM